LLSPLFLGFLVALVALVGFTRLADEMREGETKHFDETISRAIHGLTSPARTEIMIKLTDIGNTTGVIVVAAIACVVLWFRHRPQGAVLLAVTIGGGSFLLWALKQHFQRHRPPPCDFLPQPKDYSFPSGHALVSFCLYMVLAAMITKELNSASRRVAVWVISAVMVLGIGLSRIYLCMHYPSDVIAGYLAALAWVLGVTLVYRRLR